MLRYKFRSTLQHPLDYISPTHFTDRNTSGLPPSSLFRKRKIRNNLTVQPRHGRKADDRRTCESCLTYLVCEASKGPESPSGEAPASHLQLDGFFKDHGG
jgi:hypothetical protein